MTTIVATRYLMAAACEKERERQLGAMHTILAPGAVFVDLQCVARNAKAGA